MTAIVLQCEILSEMLKGFLQWLAENESSRIQSNVASAHFLQ